MHKIVFAACLFVMPALGFAACTMAPPTITPAPIAADEEVVPTIDASAESLSVTLSNSQITLGLERLAFEVLGGQGDPLPASATVRAEVLRTDKVAEGQTMRRKVADGEALRFGDEIPGGGTWVVYHDFDASGEWSLDIYVTFADARTGFGRVDFAVQAPVASPKVGDRPPSVTTPKVAEGGDLSAVTSDPAPLEALYRLSLDEAMSNGTPVVVMFGAPGSCPACATTLAEVKAVMAGWGSGVNFVHVESADPADPNMPSEAARAWGLPPDVPWTFVLDGQGFVSNRVEGPIGRTELELLVKRATGS